MDESIRTVLLRNGPMGERVESWLRSQNDVDVLVATSERIKTEGDDSAVTWDTIRDSNPDLLLSAGYRHIVPSSVLQDVDMALNCHNSFLPHARGANANVWSIVEDGPVGVTIHEMIEAVDAGPIVAQRRVPLYSDDTGKSLYLRLIDAIVGLLEETWPSIRDGSYETTANPIEEGTHHTTDEFAELQELDLDAETTVGDLLDRLRALTFPPFDNAHFECDGTKYYVDIDIYREDDVVDDIQSARNTE